MTETCRYFKNAFPLYDLPVLNQKAGCR